MVKEGWLDRGDWGYVDEEGFMFMRGGYKDVMIYGGENIYGEEIEEVIEEVGGIVERGVVGMCDAV